MAKKKLVEDPKMNLDLMGAILHALMEDDLTKRKRPGNQLYIKIELRGNTFEKNGEMINKEFLMEGIIGNEDYQVQSVRFYDPKSMIKKGEMQFAEKTEELETEET